MRKRVISLLLALVMVLAFVPTRAEAVTDLTQNVKVETAKTSSITTGTIRYVNQIPGGTYFYDTYWGNNKSVADIQCNLASISMALSYCGVNKLPSQMTPFSSPSSIVSGTAASLNKPSSVSAGVDRMRSGNGKYSPVVIWMENYHTSYGTYEHWVVVADRVSDNTYYVVDPSYGIGKSAYYKVKISGSTLTAWGSNSTISGVYQFYNPSASIKHILTTKYNTNGGTIDSATYSAGTNGNIRKSGADYAYKWEYDYCPSTGLANASTFGMSRAGCVFAGWSLSKDGSTRIFDENELLKPQELYPNLKNADATVTLYAIWTPILTTKYNANGGRIDSATYSVGTNGNIRESGADYAYKWEYDYCPSTGLANASTFGLSRDGYEFAGWSLSKDGSTRIFDENELLKPQELYPNLKNGGATVTLYAIWTPILTTKYNTNGGTIDSATYSAGTNGDIRKSGADYAYKWEYDYCPSTGLANASTFGLSRDGYEFVGWSLSKDGSTRIFDENELLKPQELYPNLKNGGATVTLYAIWKENVLNGSQLSDLNGDEKTDNADMTILLRHVVGIEPAEDEVLLAKLDIDGSGAVDAADVTAFAQLLSK